MKNYLNINRKAWDRKTKEHYSSDFYSVPEFILGENSLKDIELNLLGDIKGKSVLHLQCHFGQDSISLSRMGAKVTGIDFSPVAIEKAKVLTKKCKTETTFICSDIYSLPNVLKQEFDIVFTSYGTIGWLPDLQKWGNVIATFLKPKGLFVMADFHPVIWMYNDSFTAIEFSYFKTNAIIENKETYTDSSLNEKNTMVSWNHSLGDIFNALLNNGIALKNFKEYNYSPYNCFENTIEVSPEKFQIKGLENIIPMVYSILATNN